MSDGFAELNVGFNWDIALAKKLCRLHNKGIQKHKTRIKSVYGSEQGNPIGTARPRVRIPKDAAKNFFECCDIFQHEGIDINYTLNPSCLGDLDEFEANRPRYLEWLGELSEFVDVITIAHPLILELVQEFNFKNDSVRFDIEISTILNVDSLSLFDYYRKENVDTICLAIQRNRDFKFLKKVGNLSPNYPTCELLANEFCNVGGYNCHGIYRQSCYQCHSHNVFGACDNYPMSRCTKSRWENPSSWLKAKFILPQWMWVYQEECNIHNFKISGRTHNSEYIYNTTKAYIEREYKGNLLELWAQLEMIWGGIGKQKEVTNKVIIPCDNDWLSGPTYFLNYFVDSTDRPPCSDKLCGDPNGCCFCDGIYKNIMELGEQK